MIILHDLGIVIPKRLRAFVHHDRATKRRERALAYLYTIDGHIHERHASSAY